MLEGPAGGIGFDGGCFICIDSSTLGLLLSKLLKSNGSDSCLPNEGFVGKLA